jgi:hypothetical protein
LNVYPNPKPQTPNRKNIATIVVSNSKQSRVCYRLNY